MRTVIPYSENVDDIDPIKELIKKKFDIGSWRTV